MNLDVELEGWRREWQSETAVPPDLRRRVARQVRALRLGLWADAVVTVVMGGGTIALAVRWPEADVIVLAAATWLFVAAAWTFVLVVNRARWAPSALDTAAFVEFLIGSCRARLAAVRFGAVLTVCEVVFGLGWIYHHSPPRTSLWRWLFFSSIPMDLVWVLLAALFGFMIWYRRKKRAELANLLTLSLVP
jgi:hypothetical protein